MKSLFHPRFKHPKTLFLIIMIFLAYAIFKTYPVDAWVSQLGELSYIGTFISGILFAFGFTTPFAIGYFAALNPSNVLIHGLIAGLGASFSSLMIFKLIRFSFMDEFEKMEKNKFFVFAGRKIEKAIGPRLDHYLLYAIAGIIISSPLPDEVGVTMLAGLTHIKSFSLLIISFICSTIGISLLLML